MRRRILATLFLAAFTMTATGCRQTNGTIAAGPAPAGSLSPVNPNQLPILGPLGGNTRVTPPPTGSYQPAGGYIGVPAAPAPPFAPVAQPSLGVNQNNQPAGIGPIGSGVQVAGWTGTNSVVPTAPVANIGPVQANTVDPRSGGMRINDLTGAPPPPGYRPTIAQVPPGYGGSAAYGIQPQSVPSAIPNTPNSVVIAPQQNWQQQNVAPSINQSAVSPASAHAPIPEQSFAPAVSQIPTATTAQGPTTEPIDSSSGSGDLMWRRPGSQ
jgi:hypothetical protein